MLLVLLQMLLVLLQLLPLLLQVRQLAYQPVLLLQRCCCSALSIFSALLGRLVVSLETSHLLQARDTWVSSDRKLHRHSRCCKHRHLIQILLSQGAYRSSRVKNKYSATCRGNDLSAILRTSSLCGSADKLFRSSQRAGTQCWCDTASVCIVKTTQRVAHPHCL